jgi:hypothetical protein
MLLPLHEATEQTQRNDSKKEVTECNVFELMGMFYRILERLIIFTPCSKHGDVGVEGLEEDEDDEDHG